MTRCLPVARENVGQRSRRGARLTFMFRTSTVLRRITSRRSLRRRTRRGKRLGRRTPFSMSVGKVETEYHGLSLRVRSVLDPAQDTDSGQKSNSRIVRKHLLCSMSHLRRLSRKKRPLTTLSFLCRKTLWWNLSQPKAAPAPTFDDGEVEAQVLDWGENATKLGHRLGRRGVLEYIPSLPVQGNRWCLRALTYQGTS